jgi:hypothetical protein
MNDATDVPGPRTAAGLPPLAFIYDRHATKTTLVLDDRLARVKAYAKTRGWSIGGWFVDTDDDALSDTSRPALDALCNTVASHTGGRVCLIHDWDRLSRDPDARAKLLARVKDAGGWTATTDGHDDRDPIRPGTAAALYRPGP